MTRRSRTTSIFRRCKRPDNQRTHAKRDGEEGFTLIELIIVIVILPIIIGGIAAAVIASLNDQVGLSTKLGDSHDTQLTSIFFGRDIQSSLSITTNSSATLCGTGTQVLGIKLEPTNTNTPSSSVSYVKTSASSPAIVRNFCTTGSPTTSAISHDVSTATPTLTSSTSTSALCGLNPVSTFVPSFCFANVELKITEVSAYSYSLIASPRQESSGGGGGPPPGLSLLLLGSGGSVINCQSGAGTLNVNGEAAVNSSSSGSVNGSYIINASNVYSQSSTPVTTAPPGQAPTYNTATTQPQSQGPQIPDPYADLPDPPTTGPGTTPQPSTNSLPGPGVYANQVTINSAQTPLTSGIYIFEKGLSIQGGGSITVAPGAGVLFFIGIPNAPAGTAQPAAYKVAGSGFVNLTAPASGPYTGIAIFQARTDSNQLQVTGTSTASTYAGVIYAPDANVNTGGGGGLNSGAIVASSLSCGGGGTVTIGPSASTVASTITSATPNPSVSGQSVTITATVKSQGNFTPVGNEEFLANGTPIASCGGSSGVALSNGQASCTTSFVSSGSPYAITATYVVPAARPWLATFYQGQTSTPVNQTVNKASTTTSSVMSSANPSVVGQSVTYSATVSTSAPGSGTPTGNVEFLDGGIAIVGCGGVLGQPLSAGTATCTITGGYPAAGTHTITAQYLGSSDFNGSTSASPNLTQTVVTGVVPQISGFTEAAANGGKQTYSGTTNVPNGTITIDVCAGSIATCTKTTTGFVKEYQVTVSSSSWSKTTTGSDVLTSGSAYTATAVQVDAANVSSSPQTIFFTGN